MGKMLLSLIQSKVSAGLWFYLIFNRTLLMLKYKNSLNIIVSFKIYIYLYKDILLDLSQKVIQMGKKEKYQSIEICP